MMKQTQTILAKYCGRAFSIIASSPVSSSVMHRWKEQKSLGLCVAFIGGYFGHVLKNAYKRREHWYKVDGLMKECKNRSEKLHAGHVEYRRGAFEKLAALNNSV